MTIDLRNLTNPQQTFYQQQRCAVERQDVEDTTVDVSRENGLAGDRASFDSVRGWQPFREALSDRFALVHANLELI